MLTSITPDSLNSLQDFVRIGTVEEVIDAGHIKVTLHHGNRAVEVWSSFAMGNTSLPSIGDNVLVAGECIEKGFVIGVFPKANTQTKTFTIESDIQTGKTTLTLPEGDLDICSKQGSIHLQAAESITLNGSTFALDVAKGEIKMAEASYEGLHLSATIERTKLFLGKINTTVGRLIERAKNVYRRVDNLNQVQAGRMRTIVDGSYHLKSERIIEKAEKEVRIDGKKINLG
jgi:hypothetical protein